MRNLLRTRYFVACLFVMSVFVSPGAKAGPFFPVCMAACVAGCALNPACIAACGATVCIGTCFGVGTTVNVMQEGRIVQKNVENVVAGDKVLTLKDGKLALTRVLRNLKSSGKFEFVQISTQNLQNSTYKQVRVTPQHGLVLLNSNGTMSIDSASHVKVGDKMISSSGDTLSVIDVSVLTMDDKYTLETAEGTVLASDLLMTTLCSEEVAGGERLFDSTMKDWHMRHNFSEEN